MTKTKFYITDESTGPNHTILNSFYTVKECIAFINDKNLIKYYNDLHIWEAEGLNDWPGISLTPLKDVIRKMKIEQL